MPDVRLAVIGNVAQGTVEYASLGICGFVVYGAGAISGVVGARLFQHGHQVVLIARGAPTMRSKHQRCPRPRDGDQPVAGRPRDPGRLPQHLPFRRVCEPEDVAETMLFSSPSSAYFTDQLIRLDGGWGATAPRIRGTKFTLPKQPRRGWGGPCASAYFPSARATSPIRSST